MDPVALATAAVTAILPYLLGLGGKAAEEGAKSGGKAAFDWVKGKLTSASGREAVADVEKTPDAEENRLALQAALVKALKADPAAAAELAKLLPAGAIGQTVNITGDNNIGVNASGSTVSINGG